MLDWDSDDSYSWTMAHVKAVGLPSSGDDLLDKQMDLQSHLTEVLGIHSPSVDVQPTENAQRLLTASCVLVGSIPVADVVTAVTTMWTTRLRYRYKDAHHSTLLSTDEALFEFVSQTEPNGIYITGQIQLHGPFTLDWWQTFYPTTATRHPRTHAALRPTQSRAPAEGLNEASIIPI